MFLIKQIFSNLNKLTRNQQILTKIQPNLASVLTNSKFYSNIPTPYEIVDLQENRRKKQDVMDKVNEQIASKQQGSLFALVHIAGKQFKITEGDIIVVEGYWPPDAGDKISLDKVLMVGAVDFTLVGCPLVQRDLVKVEATVIEKTLSHTKTHFKKKRRKQYMRINFYRIPQTMLRINRIEVIADVNHPPDVSEGQVRSL